MRKIVLNDANKVELNWLVAKAMGLDVSHKDPKKYWARTDWDGDDDFLVPDYTKDWNELGPKLKELRISVTQKHDGWAAAGVYDINDEVHEWFLDHDPLRAICKCVVGEKLKVSLFEKVEVI